MKKKDKRVEKIPNGGTELSQREWRKHSTEGFGRDEEKRGKNKSENAAFSLSLRI